MNLEIKILPMFDDNYGFIVRDPLTEKTLTVDPGDPEVILKELERNQWQLDFILNTHHHHDHVGGNALIKSETNCKIIGPVADSHRIPEMDQGVSQGDTVIFGKHKIEIIETPGHTTGHICFHFAGEKIVFVGDTLFAMGCGRLFEGTPAQMWHSLKKISAFPEETKVYCAHEYTLKNGQFALTVEPNNLKLQQRVEEVHSLRNQGKKTIPTTIGLEQETNPFLRADKIKTFSPDAIKSFEIIRGRRNSF